MLSAGIARTLPLPLGEPLEFMRLLWAVDHGLQRWSKQMAAALGVTGPQRLVLRVVGRFPGLSAGQLAQVLHLHPSTLTGILRRLEGKGLLTRRRDPRDGRRAVLGLSRAGRRLDMLATGTVEALVTGGLSGQSDTEVLAARRVLLALAESLEDAGYDSRSRATRR